jgi:UDP-2-acetamido-3-amino-2,3-dideoxy-glucuronate N-acetyltransferase
MNFIHESSYIDSDVKLGSDLKIWHFCHIMSGSIIGDKCILGQNVMIGPKVKIGTGCKIQNNVSIYEGVELGKDVFCGPSCVFTNVINPRAFINRKNEFKKTYIHDGVSLGANSTIICGVSIGKFSLIGAGAVVTKDVQDYALMVGNPAKRIGWVSEFGVKLDTDLICRHSGQEYLIQDNSLIKKT